MKKVFTILLILMVVFAFTACSKSDSTNKVKEAINGTSWSKTEYGGGIKVHTYTFIDDTVAYAKAQGEFDSNLNLINQRISAQKDGKFTISKENIVITWNDNSTTELPYTYTDGTFEITGYKSGK